jgi:hypothetical protein
MSVIVDGKNFNEPVYPLAKVNLKTYTWKTGAELAALTGIQLGKIYRCRTTGNGFVVGNYYMRNFDDTGWIVVFALGGLSEIMASAIRQGVYFAQHFPKKFMFKQETSTGGTLTDDDTDGGIEISTNATTGGRAQLSQEETGCPISFGFPAVMKFKMELNDAKNITARIGMGMNDYNTVPNTGVRQFGLEIENATTTHTFWSLVSGDGTTFSSQLTSNMPISQNNTFRYILEFIPGIAVKMYVNGTLIATKTTHIPSSGNATTRTFVAFIRTKSDDNNTINLRSLVLAFHNGNNY